MRKTQEELRREFANTPAWKRDAQVAAKRQNRRQSAAAKDRRFDGANTQGNVGRIGT